VQADHLFVLADHLFVPVDHLFVLADHLFVPTDERSASGRPSVRAGGPSVGRSRAVVRSLRDDGSRSGASALLSGKERSDLGR
jgi:hypothetical protein